MAKRVISLLVYQIGTNNKLNNPQQIGIHVGSIRGAIKPTWNGGLPQPKEQSGVFDNDLAQKVYSYIEYVTPSNAGVERIYTNSTVAQIVQNINS